MGAGASTSAAATEEQKQLEELQGRIGRDLPLLKNAYSRFSKSDAVESVAELSKLEQCFTMDAGRIRNCSDDSDLRMLLPHLGSVVCALVFKPEKELISWIAFLKGYDYCCQQVSLASRLRFVLYFFCTLRNTAKKSPKMEVVNEGGDLEGNFLRNELRDFLWVCWLMMYYNKLESEIELPDVEPMVRGALKSSSSEEQISVKELYSWIISSIPNLGNAMVDYVQSCLQQLCEDSQKPAGSYKLENLSGHLTAGRVWCLGLSQKDHVAKILLSSLIKDQITPLYRSPVHGKGMNRFWSQVEGYKETVLFLISGMSPEEGSKPWLLAAIIPGGFQNRDTFYGSGTCCIVVVEPEFIVLRPTGKEKNYVYSHKTLPGGGYNSRPMPNGIGFGGTLGNERIWLEDDFSTVTLRHHAADKTYQSGFLLPHQGYAPLSCQVLEVELWGLGGKSAEDQMLSFQEREKLFAEQRRKVDLKAFGNWQDSPEKMMLDMVSNPNKAEREER